MLNVVLGILGAGALVGVLYLIGKGVSNTVALRQRDEALKLERAHTEALERAAADDRRRAAEELNAKADSVRDADGAAELLRDVLRR